LLFVADELIDVFGVNGASGSEYVPAEFRGNLSSPLKYKARAAIRRRMPFKVVPPLYGVWQSMRRRCLTPTTNQFADYGGRGIKICEEWDSFEQFAKDMGERPPGYTLERVDNDGDYGPSNCKWASRKEQQRNQRVTRRVIIGDRSYIAAELAEIASLKTDSILDRVARGQTYEEVVSPIRVQRTDHLIGGGKANGARQSARTHCMYGHVLHQRRLAELPQVPCDKTAPSSTRFLILSRE
jgi:hypothetical protein